MKSWRTWNWWKLGFFVTLFAFEGAREVAVLESSKPVDLAAIKTVSQFGDLIHAEGVWIRNDNGERLLPLLVTIECNRSEGNCLEASTRVLPGRSVVTPTAESYPARFGPGTVEYQGKGVCTNYSVRIDVKAEEAYQTRTRTKDNSPNCRIYGSKLSARLGNGWDDLKPALEGHFVPLFSILKAVMDVF
jgi:hypothetical protein